MVIWILALMAVVVVGFATVANREARIARNLAASARARALADAAVNIAVLGFLDPKPDTRWALDGSARQVAIGGAMVSVRVQDEQGKVDLNRAPPALVAGLFAALGLDPAALAEVERRRTAAPKPASDAWTSDLHDAAFPTVEDLRLVPGIGPLEIARLKPFATVYSERQRIDPATAPREVLLAVPGMDPGLAERVLASRAARTALPRLTGFADYLAPGDERVVTVTAAAQTGGATFVREAIVARTDVPLSPYGFLTWAQGQDVVSAAPARPE